jgi:hypothetical protein
MADSTNSQVLNFGQPARRCPINGVKCHCLTPCVATELSNGKCTFPDCACITAPPCPHYAHAPAAPAPQPVATGEREAISEQERHAIACALWQFEHATPDDPECCFDYELVGTLLKVLDRALASQPRSEGSI